MWEKSDSYFRLRNIAINAKLRLVLDSTLVDIVQRSPMNHLINQIIILLASNHISVGERTGRWVLLYGFAKRETRKPTMHILFKLST